MSEETGKGEGVMAHANVGHGHVYPRADGYLARCGGPGMCSECSKELSQVAHPTMKNIDGQGTGPASLVDAWLKHFEVMSRKAALCERMAEGIKAYLAVDGGGSVYDAHECGCRRIDLERIIDDFDREAKK